MNRRPPLHPPDIGRILFDEDSELLLSAELAPLKATSIKVDRVTTEQSRLEKYDGLMVDVVDGLTEAAYLPVRRLLLEAT